MIWGCGLSFFPKIDPRAYAAIFLGYDLKTKAYRLLDPQTNSLFLSQSVRFYPDYSLPDPTIISRFGDDLEEHIGRDMLRNSVDTI